MVYTSILKLGCNSCYHTRYIHVGRCMFNGWMLPSQINIVILVTCCHSVRHFRKAAAGVSEPARGRTGNEYFT